MCRKTSEPEGLKTQFAHVCNMCHRVHYMPFLAYSLSHVTDKLAGSIVSSRSMHGTGPSTSTSASTGATDLMPYGPASDLDATSSAQVNTGGSVKLPFASLSIDSDLLLSSRPPMTSESLHRIPLWKSVIFLL